MKNREITYFAQSAERAERRYKDYNDRTEAQARTLGFVCAGNLRKSSRKCLNTITDKSVRLYSAYTLRRLFLRMYRMKIDHSPNFIKELNDILQTCQTEALPFQNYDYYSLSCKDCTLFDKYEAVRHFIEEYGTATDKKYLLSKFILHEEIRQNGKTILSHTDGILIPIVFRNLTNAAEPDYKTYIENVAIPDMGFDYGSIEYYRDGVPLKCGTIQNR